MKRLKKKGIVLFLAMALGVTMVPVISFGTDTAGDTSAEVRKQEYILTATSDLSELKLPSYVEDISFDGTDLALIKVKNGITEDQIREDLEAQAENFSVQPNFVYEATRVNDPFYGLQWGLHNEETGVDIGFEESYDFIMEHLNEMSETVVAVIDTGMDYTHSDLAANIWVNSGETPGNDRDDDGNGYRDDVHGYDFAKNRPLSDGAINNYYAHGTHCAGIIGAATNNGNGIAGIASATGKVSIMDLKVLEGPKGLGDSYDVVRAIRYAERNGADICNLSMGSYVDDETLYRTIAASDMLFVCAAGNDGLNLDNKPIYPGCYDLSNVICVGNAQSNGRLNSKSNYSSKSVDIAAPGTVIHSTIPNNKYDDMSGTSMAAPFVTGAAAVLHSYYKDISAAGIRHLLLSGAQRKSSLNGRVVSGRFLDLYKSLTDYSEDDYQIDVKAPQLKASVSKISGSYKQKLKIAASDDSGLLPTVRYARGSQSLSYFRSGAGTKLSLSADGTVSKTLTIPGIYSVYAVDAAGNDVLVKATCTVNAVSSLKLNYSKKSLAKGKAFTLKATLSKSGVNGRKLTYTSSDRTIAVVNSKGVVTAKKKKGTATITVKTSNGLSKTCKVTVK
ncbi:S8 family serine peptidase [Emergencia sp. JLR.KK010]|uniref:S8 family serine peptidase n=1 Tax=Emergencia sp. JLR.KK010 TaxID=3114296 RepID=UPI0030CF0683